MENESFAETIVRILDNSQELYCNSSLFDSAVYQFEIYGSFLDCIPIADREKVIAKDIATWLHNYNFAIEYIHTGMYRITSYEEAQSHKNTTLTALQKFEDMLYKNFTGLEILYKTFENEKMQNIGVPDEIKDPLKKYKAIEVLKSTIADMRQDIESKTYNIFNKDLFETERYTTKRDLTRILDDLIKKYNIKGHSPHKKNLIDNILKD